MGRGMGCDDGEECDCDCHAWDSRTCAEIVSTHKRAQPELDVSHMAGMHRNKILNHLTLTLSDDDLTTAHELNEVTPGMRGPLA